jgi:hypothetical protein
MSVVKTTFERLLMDVSEEQKEKAVATIVTSELGSVMDVREEQL